MPDPGFVPGLIGVGIQMTVNQIIRHINIVRRYRKELGVLKVSLMRIEPIVKEIQHILLAWNSHKDEVSAVDNWFEELEALLKQASEIVHPRNLIGRRDVVSRHQTSTKITNLSKDIDKQLTLCALVHMVQYHELSRKILEGQTQINERIEALIASSSSSAITYQGAHAPTGTIYSEKGYKTETGTANRLSNPSKVSSFQDQQLDACLPRDGSPSYESTIMQLLESYENPMAGYLKQGFVSHDTEEGVPTENHWLGKALCDFPARCDDELNLTAGEEVKILAEEEEWFYVSNGKTVGWVPMLFVNSY